MQIRSQKRRRHIERLEARQMLAGNVTAEIVDGDLVVTGDGLDNRIAIYAGGLHPGVHGENTADGNPTSINGAANGSFNLDGLTGDVVVRMGDGRDSVLFEGAFPGAMVLEGGAGDDTFWSVSGLSTASELIINTGSGENQINLSGRTMRPSWDPGTLRIGSNLIITGGNQRDQIIVEQPWVGNDFVINSGDGPDIIRPTWCIVGNFAGVDSGPGDDEILARFRAKTISLRTGEGSAVVSLGWGTYASQDLGIIAGSGATIIDAVNARVDGTTYVVGGQSNDYAKFNGCQLTELQVNMGSGSDRLDVTGSILDRIFADLGADNDWLLMTYTAVNDQATFLGGLGFDLLSRGGNAVRRQVLGGFEFLN
jgi:hypothetical protein